MPKTVSVKLTLNDIAYLHHFVLREIGEYPENASIAGWDILAKSLKKAWNRAYAVKEG